MLHFLSNRFSLLKPVVNSDLWGFAVVLSKFLWVAFIHRVVSRSTTFGVFAVRWLVCTGVARVTFFAQILVDTQTVG